MAKRRRTVTRSHTTSSTEYRAGFTRGAATPTGKRQMAPPSARNNNRVWWIAGGVAVVLALAGLVYIYGQSVSKAAGARPGSSSRVARGSGPTVGPTVNSPAVKPPVATP